MRRIGLSALALLFVGSAEALSAQAQESRAHAALEVSIAGTSVRESAAVLASAAGLLTLGGRFAFGAGGALMLGSSTLETQVTGLDQDLRLAYGGALLQVTLGGSARRSVALRALAGAGNAKIRLVVGGSEVAADNFGVIEPEIVGTVSVAGPLRIGVGAGYRHVFGVDDLPNVATADLRGFSARLRLSIHTP